MSNHRIALLVLLVAACLAYPARASACFSCSNGVNAAEWASRCPVSQALWDTMCSCVDASCPGCGGFCADPAAPLSDTCTSCLYGACTTSVSACSYDTTGCVSCSGWLASPGAPADITEDNLCWTAIQPEIDLSACACAPLGACSQKCGAACVDWGGGYYSLHAWAATPACLACLPNIKHGCAASYGVCAAN